MTNTSTTNDKPLNWGQLFLISGAIIFAAFLLGKGYETHPATIGGTEVPVLRCEEDEVIGFDSTRPAPYPLACIHIDTITGSVTSGPGTKITCDTFETDEVICVDGNTGKVIARLAP